MEVKVAFLADDTGESDGKLNAIGLFNEIRAVSFPTIHPRMILFLILEASASEAGDLRDLDISLLDDDARKLESFQYPFVVESSVTEGIPISMTVIAELLNLELPRHGSYLIEAKIDDSRASVPLYAVQI